MILCEKKTNALMKTLGLEVGFDYSHPIVRPIDNGLKRWQGTSSRLRNWFGKLKITASQSMAARRH
jgi:hypothetical protein